MMPAYMSFTMRLSIPQFDGRIFYLCQNSIALPAMLLSSFMAIQNPSFSEHSFQIKKVMPLTCWIASYPSS